MTVQKLKLSYMETLIHLIKGNVGSGIFAMGDAMKNSGIILGTILVVCLAAVCIHCQHLMIQAAENLYKKHDVQAKLDFAKTVQYSFLQGTPNMTLMAKKMKRIVNFCLVATQLGFCCVYFIFITDNIKQVADAHGYVVDIHLIMSYTFIPILLPCLLRSWKFLTPVSMLANVLMVGGISMVIYFCVHKDLPCISERPYVASIRTLPLFFGTALFCFEGIGLVLSLRKEMQNPDNFSKTFGVLNVGMIFVASLFIVVGFVGYLRFGEEVLGSVTLNLPKKEILYQVVKLTISAGVLLTYCLQLFIVVEITWPFILAKKLKHNRHPVMWELLYRGSLVLFTFVMAQVIPFLNYFISLVGSVCSAVLCLVFPVTLDLLLRYIDEELTKFVIAKDSFILIIAVLGMITGGYESISSIIIAFREIHMAEKNAKKPSALLISAIVANITTD